MSQFIGYYVDGINTDKSVPIATGTTQEEAQTKAIRRVLIFGMLSSYVTVQERNDISETDFKALGLVTDEFAAKHGEEPNA